jgi:hypothetical protein
MEYKYVFSDIKKIFDKPKIMGIIKKVSDKHHESKVKEGNTITLLITGHGRERYKENFRKIVKANSNYYSDFFNYIVKKQERKNTVRILSKAGKPKVCAWDYTLCSKSLSSQDIIIELSHLFFEKETNNEDTFTLMNALSIYFKTIYPLIIEKISLNYRDMPEDKDPGSPGAEGYQERFEDFQKLIISLKENKFSQLKSLNHEKVFTIRPDNAEEYESHCEKYHFEIVDIRIDESSKNDLIDFMRDNLKIHKNLVQNYYSMNQSKLEEYINSYKYAMNDIYSLKNSDYDKFFLIKFIYNLYFGHELLLSEIVEFFTIIGFDTINIIDNTCRVQDVTAPFITSSPTPVTEEIEEMERIHNPNTKTRSRSQSMSKSRSRSQSNSYSKGGKNNKTRRIRY